MSMIVSQNRIRYIIQTTDVLSVINQFIIWQMPRRYGSSTIQIKFLYIYQKVQSLILVS